MITVPFALWHVPGWLVETGSLAMALVLVGLFALPHLASRVIVGWLYNGTGRSVLLVGLFHAAHNATVGAFGFARTFIPGSDEATLVMASDIVIAAALLIVVLTRGRLAYRTQRRRRDRMSICPTDPPWARPTTRAGDGSAAAQQ